MRKKCSQCGMICFASDEICGRCGAKTLFEIQLPSDTTSENIEIGQNKISWWGYLIFFVLAVIIEFFALLPILANIGWRHSANAPMSDFERKSQFWAFVLHLPTVIVPWTLNQLIDIFSPFYLFIPFTQIIFWTFCLAFIWKRLEKPYAALITLASLITFLLLSLSVFR